MRQMLRRDFFGEQECWYLRLVIEGRLGRVVARYRHLRVELRHDVRQSLSDGVEAFDFLIL